MVSDFFNEVNKAYNKGIHCNSQVEKALTAYGFLKNPAVNKGAKLSLREKESENKER